MKTRKTTAIPTHPRPLPLAQKSSATRRGEKPFLATVFFGRREGFGVGLSAAILTFFFLLLPSISKAQETFEQSTVQTSQFSNDYAPDNKFVVLNINGSVTVEAYDGETIELTVKERLEGINTEIRCAKEELEFKLERKGDVIVAWLDAPFTELELEEGEYQYDWDNVREDRDDREYQFTHTIHVRVPKNILLEVSTINGQAVTVIGSFKKVEADNINGSIILKNMTAQTRAETINGDITAKYEEVPDGDSTFETINGTIEVFMPENLSADIYFESLHGDLFTNFENLQRLKPEVQTSTASNHSSTTYHIDEFSPVRIDDGDIDLCFEVLNGDVYLRKW